MDGRPSPLDFALILDFSRPLDLRALRRGSASARNAFPSTGSAATGKRWLRMPDAGGVIESPCPPDARIRVLEAFVDAPFDVTSEPPVRQMLVRSASGQGACLATRFHHCAADLLSAWAWLRHQLRVAKGAAQPSHPAPFRQPVLRAAPPGARRNPYRGRSDPIWTRAGRPSGKRRWSAITVPPSRFAGLSKERDGFTYNDVLVAATLETTRWWNSRNGAPDRRVGVWVPMNIRREQFAGFGNGSSRIRVRLRPSGDASLRERCLDVRAQVDRARHAGEWTVPSRPILPMLPLALAAPLIRAYLQRPWADMGSLSFTHLQRWPGQAGDFGALERLELVGALHKRHPLMLAAVTALDRTWLTLTFDPALLREKDVAEIGQRFLETALSVAEARE